MKYTMLLIIGILIVVQMTSTQDTGSTGETASSPTNPGLQQDAVPTAGELAAPQQQVADQPQADQPPADNQPQADQPIVENQPQADQPAADEPATNQQADAAPGDQADAEDKKKKPEEEKREQTPNDAPVDPTKVTSPTGQTSTDPGLLHNPSTVQPAVSPNSTMKKEKPTEKSKNSASGIYGSTLRGTVLAILLFSAM